MLAAELFIMALLALISVQDLKTRLVFWFCFPLLAVAFCVIHWFRAGSITQLWRPVAFNLAIVVVMLLAVTIYVWITRKKLINIADTMLGWADILFLLSVACYFSVPNFLIFNIVSMSCALIAWIIWQALAERKTKRIPLVGFQAITLTLFLSADWWLHLVNLTDDAWLFNLVSKWN